MKTNYIFFDNNFENRILARDVQKTLGKNSNIIFVAKKDSWEDPIAQKFLADVKIDRVDIEGDTLELSPLDLRKILPMGVKLKFFFLSRNEGRNTSLAFYAMSVAKELGINSDDMDFYISPDWDEIEVFFTEFQTKIARNFEIHLVNSSRLATNSLMAQFKPVNALSFDSATLLALEDLNVAVLGFNNNTREALFRVYQQGRFEGSAFNVDVYDLLVDLKTKSFRSNYEGFIQDVNMNLFAEENYDLLIESLLAKLEKYHLVIVDLADRHLNEKMTLRMQDKLLDAINTKTTIAVHILDECSILKDIETNPSVIAFGLAKDIFNLDTIVLENYYKGAQFVNRYYNDNKEDSMKLLSWKGMDAFKKNSNLNVADFNYAIVELIGKDVFANFKDGDEYRQYLRDNPKKYETLTKTEHLRWMAYLYANAWNLLPLEGDVMVSNKDEERKLHTCLVPFDDLNAVSEMFGEDYKKYDSDNIDIVYDIYNILKRV